MCCRALPIGFVSLALASSASIRALWPAATTASVVPIAATEDGDEDQDETAIGLDEAPAAVQEAAVKVAGGRIAITKVVTEKDDEIIVYEIEYTQNGVNGEATISTAGDILAIEKDVQDGQVPNAAWTALKKEFPNAKFADPVIVTATYYEIDVMIDGQKHEVRFNAAGDIDDDEEGDDD